jgi:hypothetical protein
MKQEPVMEYAPNDSEVVLSEAPRTVYKEQKEIDYPKHGVIPPIGGKGEPIYFKTTDAQAWHTITNLGTLLNSARNEIEKYRKRCEDLDQSNQYLRSKSDTVSMQVVNSDVQKDNRIKYLEQMYKELVSYVLTLIPISLQSTGENGEPGLNLGGVVSSLMEKARIKHEPGEIKVKRYYRDKGSF